MQFNQAIPLLSALVFRGTEISLSDEKIRYSLRLSQEDLAQARKLTELDLPNRVGTATVGHNNIISACLGPDEWFILAHPATKGAVKTALARLSNKVLNSATEISHRNIAFVVRGEKAASVLNVGCPLDLSLASFPVGKATRTIFEGSQILLIRTDQNEFHIECWRSFGPYLWTFFNTISSENLAA